jgi:hypothetical protein
MFVDYAGATGRGLFTTEAVAAGHLLLLAAPPTRLYSEQGTTPWTLLTKILRKASPEGQRPHILLCVLI